MLAFRPTVSRVSWYAVVPRSAPRPPDVRAHQSQISWFGEEVPNARVEIGVNGVKMGPVEHKACEDALMKWSDDQTAVAFYDGDLHLGSGTKAEPADPPIA